MTLSIWIRTHTDRLYLAEALKTMCDHTFGCNVEILNTGSASKYFSQKFILMLASKLSKCQSTHILILEDDIDIGPTAKEAVTIGISRRDAHNWYSVDTTTDILKHTIHVPNFGYILTQATHINYSGAVLIPLETLRNYVEYYILHISEFEYPNMDVTLSAYLLKVSGHLHLRPGHFIHKCDIKSSISPNFKGRYVHKDHTQLHYQGVLL